MTLSLHGTDPSEANTAIRDLLMDKDITYIDEPDGCYGSFSETRRA